MVVLSTAEANVQKTEMNIGVQTKGIANKLQEFELKRSAFIAASSLLGSLEDRVKKCEMQLNHSKSIRKAASSSQLPSVPMDSNTSGPDFIRLAPQEASLDRLKGLEAGLVILKSKLQSVEQHSHWLQTFLPTGNRTRFPDPESEGFESESFDDGEEAEVEEN